MHFELGAFELWIVSELCREAHAPERLISDGVESKSTSIC
jgi:hypothetical protein